MNTGANVKGEGTGHVKYRGKIWTTDKNEATS